MIRLEYTRFSVAFPKLRLEDVYDEISLSLAHPEGGSVGDMKWGFHRFPTGHTGVQMSVFGDGLACLFDLRVQGAIAEWRALSDPDAITPAEFVSLLERHGAEASRYMTAPT